MDQNINRGRCNRLEEKHNEEQGLSLFINTNDPSLTIIINIRQIVGNDSCTEILNKLMTNEIDDRRCLLVISAIFSVFNQLYGKLVVNKRNKKTRKKAGNNIANLNTEFIATVFGLITNMVPAVRETLLTDISAPRLLLMAMRLEIRRICAQISISQLRQITLTINNPSVIVPKDWTMRILSQAVYLYVVTLFELAGDTGVPLKKSPNIDCQPRVSSVFI